MVDRPDAQHGFARCARAYRHRHRATVVRGRRRPGGYHGLLGRGRTGAVSRRRVCEKVDGIERTVVQAHARHAIDGADGRR